MPREPCLQWRDFALLEAQRTALCLYLAMASYAAHRCWQQRISRC